MRSGLIMVAGAVLIAAPVALNLSVAALVTGVFVGALAIALGLAGTASQDRATLPLSAQAVYDRGLALGLLLVAIIFGIAGERAALGFFGATGLATLLVSGTTRYSAAGP